MAIAAMDIDINLNSPIKRSVCGQTKRSADCSGHQDFKMNPEASVFTPRKPRTPAKLRLSVSVKKAPFFDLQESGIRETLLTDNRKRALTDSSTSLNGSVLPPPDFDEASYPKGWVVGKRRRLVNVDVVESMRRIAVYEMNRKDREISFLNEQLDEDARMMAYLQLQLQQERSRRVMKERENMMLNGRIAAIMSMFGEEELEEGQIQQEDEDTDDDHEDQPSVSSEDEHPPTNSGLPFLDNEDQPSGLRSLDD